MRTSRSSLGLSLFLYLPTPNKAVLTKAFGSRLDQDISLERSCYSVTLRIDCHRVCFLLPCFLFLFYLCSVSSSSISIHLVGHLAFSEMPLYKRPSRTAVLTDQALPQCLPAPNPSPVLLTTDVQGQPDSSTFRALLPEQAHTWPEFVSIPCHYHFVFLSIIQGLLSDHTQLFMV